ESRTTQVFLDAFRQRLVYEFINFTMNALTRDKDLLDERELFVILVDFEFYQAADSFAGALTGGDISELMDDRRNLLIDAIFDERDCFRRERICERCVAQCKIVQALRDKLMHLRFESVGGHE